MAKGTDKDNQVLNHFPFYRSYAEAIKKLNDKDRLSILDGIMNYAFFEEEYKPKTDTTELAFTLIKPVLDTTIKKVKGGSNGGRPSSDKRPLEERFAEAEALYYLEKHNKEG